MITDLIKKSSSTSETHRHVNKNVEPSKSTPQVNATYSNTTPPDKIESSIMDATETVDLNASKSCPNVKKRKSVFDALDNRNENESNEKRKLLPNSYDSNKKGPKVNFDKELFNKMENFARKPNSNTFDTVNNSKNTDQNTKTTGQVSSANKNEAEPSLKKHKATNNNLVPPLKPEKAKPPSRPPPPLPNKNDVQSQSNHQPKPVPPPPPPPPMPPFNSEKVKPVSSTKPSPKATNSIKLPPPIPPPPPNTSVNQKEESTFPKTTLMPCKRNETTSVSLPKATSPPSFLDEIKRLNGLEGLKNMKKKKVLQAPKTANHASYLNNALEVMRPHMSNFF